MEIGLKVRAALAAILFGTVCHAQTAPTQNSPVSCPPQSQNAAQSTPCPSPAKKPSTAEQFPFPGAPAKPATSATPPPDSLGSTATPSSAAAEHPFPTTPAPTLPGEDSSSSSSNGGSNSDSSSSSGTDPDVPDTDMPKPGTEGSSVHRKLPKVQRVQTDDERVDEDLKVAKFYMRDDNLKGAYLRAQDAVKIQPDYSAAHYALAEIAQKMKKKDEAIAEFQTYLKLDPEGEKAKEVRRALDELK
jgi:cell fate (sporulation/competence/biofilm development) regulator YlbF (YheA/YmcA/DUF963 family)